MRDQWIVLAINLSVIAVQASIVVLARVVEVAGDRRNRSRRIERAYLASRNARRKRGEQTGGRHLWTDCANRPDFAGNAARWSSLAPGVR
jgi:hypothetical protein